VDLRSRAGPHTVPSRAATGKAPGNEQEGRSLG
jgi:hypothetical protein